MRVARVGTIGRRRARRTVLRPCCPRQRGHHEHQNRESPPRHRSCTHQLAGETSSFNGQKNALFGTLDLSRQQSRALGSCSEEHWSTACKHASALHAVRLGEARGAGRRPPAAGCGAEKRHSGDSGNRVARGLAASAVAERSLKAAL